MAASPRKSNKNQVAPEQAIVEGVFRGLGQILAWGYKALFKKSGGSKPSNGQQKQLAALREHWESVEMHLLQPTTHALAISEADKVLDSALKTMQFGGETMADRLRSAETWFTSDLYQKVWQAHKLRNQLAHEVGATVSTEQANEAVGVFRQAMYSLNVLS